MLHLARFWINLREFLLRGSYNQAFVIEYNRSRTSCALVQGQYILCHGKLSFCCLINTKMCQRGTQVSMPVQELIWKSYCQQECLFLSSFHPFIARYNLVVI